MMHLLSNDHKNKPQVDFKYFAHITEKFLIITQKKNKDYVCVQKTKMHIKNGQIWQIKI